MDKIEILNSYSLLCHKFALSVGIQLENIATSCPVNTPFTRSSKRRANVEQTSSKHQAGLIEPRP